MVKVELPQSLRIREDQNPECNKKGKLCGLYKGKKKVCLKVLVENGQFSGLEMIACEREEDKKIEVED
jgi:hypothetical protein